VLQIQDPRSGIRNPEKTFRMPVLVEKKKPDPGSATIYTIKPLTSRSNHKPIQNHFLNGSTESMNDLIK
jgi:hypothetical protein